MSTILGSFGIRVGGVDTSRQLAFGVALGALIGLLPKDNAIAVGLLVFLILSGANLLTGIVAGLGASLFQQSLTPTLHTIGNWLGQFEFVTFPLDQIMRLPGAPWTRLDDTRVLGGAVIGLLIVLPIYLVSYCLFERFQEPLQAAFRRAGFPMAAPAPLSIDTSTSPSLLEQG